jgi:hypothetical protein
VVGPVLVIPEPAKTEKSAAVPRRTVVGPTAETFFVAIAQVAKSKRPKSKIVTKLFLFPTFILNLFDFKKSHVRILYHS